MSVYKDVLELIGETTVVRVNQLYAGSEIWRQMEAQLDAIFIGVGFSGTITGLSRYLAEVAPELELVLADPEGSILTD